MLSLGVLNNYQVTSTAFGSSFMFISNISNKFKKKWHPKDARLDYEKSFSIANWKALPLDKKQLHTLSKCKACHKQPQAISSVATGIPSNEESILTQKASIYWEKRKALVKL